jgi:hypothetical protein
MQPLRFVWLAAALLGVSAAFGAQPASAATVTVSSTLVPGTLMSGAVSGAFLLPASELVDNDVTSAFATFGFVDDGELQLVSSTTTGPPSNSVTTTSYWNDLDQVTVQSGADSATAASSYYTFSVDHGFALSFPCGPRCVINFSQQFHDVYAGYTGGFGVVLPLGASSLAQLSTGALPFTLLFDGDAIFTGATLVATLDPKPPIVIDARSPSVPEPGVLSMFGLGIAGIGMVRRRLNA